MSGQGLGLLICIVILTVLVVIPYVVFVLEVIWSVLLFLLQKLITRFALLNGKQPPRQTEDQPTNG